MQVKMNGHPTVCMTVSIVLHFTPNDTHHVFSDT